MDPIRMYPAGVISPDTRVAHCYAMDTWFDMDWPSYQVAEWFSWFRLRSLHGKLLENYEINSKFVWIFLKIFVWVQTCEVDVCSKFQLDPIIRSRDVIFLSWWTSTFRNRSFWLKIDIGQTIRHKHLKFSGKLALTPSYTLKFEGSFYVNYIVRKWIKICKCEIMCWMHSNWMEFVLKENEAEREESWKRQIPAWVRRPLSSGRWRAAVTLRRCCWPRRWANASDGRTFQRHVSFCILFLCCYSAS